MNKHQKSKLGCTADVEEHGMQKTFAVLDAVRSGAQRNSEYGTTQCSTGSDVEPFCARNQNVVVS